MWLVTTQTIQMKLATEANASDSRANRTMILKPSVDVRGSFYSGFVLMVKPLFHASERAPGGGMQCLGGAPGTPVGGSRHEPVQRASESAPASTGVHPRTTAPQVAPRRHMAYSVWDFPRRAPAFGLPGVASLQGVA